MAPKIKTAREKRDEQQLRTLAQAFARRGITVRREKLSRGSAFRVKSGDCSLSGATHVFIDRRLPTEQQLAVMIDYLFDFKIRLEPAELADLSEQTRALLDSKGLDSKETHEAEAAEAVSASA